MIGLKQTIKKGSQIPEKILIALKINLKEKEKYEVVANIDIKIETDELETKVIATEDCDIIWNSISDNKNQKAMMIIRPTKKINTDKFIKKENIKFYLKNNA